MRRTPILLGVLGVVLVTAVWFLFVISPTNARIGELNDERQAAEDEELALRTTLARLREIQESELTYIAAVGALQASIPPNPDLADFVDQLDVLKQEAGIRWVSITPGLPSAVENQTYLEIPVTINIEGQYFEVLGYLYGLSELERLVVLDAVNISSQEGEDALTILTVTLNGRIFTTGQLGPLPPEDAPGATTTTTSAPSDGTTSTTTTTATTTPSTTTTTGGG